MKKININFNVINQFIDLIFPQLCFNCQELLTTSEKVICISCKANLPIIDHHAQMENTIEKFMDINPVNVFCYLQFKKDNVTQKLLHEFKYSGYRQIGDTLGHWFGEQIKSDLKGEKKIEFIVPVPLHARKLTKRGFNQSEIIANGISRALGIPVKNKLIERVLENKTQTLKSRSERMFSVRGLFKVNNPKDIKGKHVLIVDDVITTGSTLASCAAEMLDAGATKISLASLALAK